MIKTNFLPLALGLLIFSFLITSVLIVPFIDLLYKLHFTRRKEAPKKGKIPLFDKLHDKKAGTPVGGGVLLIAMVTLLFAILYPLSSYLGVYIRTAYDLRWELVVIFLTFISFGLLGFTDDFLKMFAKPSQGILGLWFGLRRNQKFLLQWILAFVIGYLLYAKTWHTHCSHTTIWKSLRYGCVVHTFFCVRNSFFYKCVQYYRWPRRPFYRASINMSCSVWDYSVRKS